LASRIILLARNIVEDVSATYFITKSISCQCCGMQLRATPTERELEKIRAKKKPITAIL